MVVSIDDEFNQRIDVFRNYSRTNHKGCKAGISEKYIHKRQLSNEKKAKNGYKAKENIDALMHCVRFIDHSKDFGNFWFPSFSMP
ncbi:hypothetical protein CEXT_562021 [Caerostris extrusa]|uniref:Uncharacterized protein n=1 Tax=Caerostris extrusa TaxID=172846 RepID=A0AAV4NLI0_CAEEX|nr:hypothetical protein CEXT_562021 [Caerostris extrusa]